MRIAIVEDDKKSSQLLSEYIRRLEEELNIEMNCVEFHSGVELATAYKPVWDLILMDIEMPVMDGMTAARQIREMDADVTIMFVTRFSQYAVESYEVGAADYLLKPLPYPVFSMKMKKALDRIRSREERYLVVRSREGAQRIPLRSVYYIEVYNHTLEYHTAHGDFATTGARSIRALEEELSEDGFARCSQSFLVNLKYVEAVDKDTVVVTGEKRLALSRSRKKAFMQKLMDYWRA